MPLDWKEKNPLGSPLGKGQVSLQDKGPFKPSSVPEVITWGPDKHRIRMWTYSQLTELSRVNLKQRALNMRDQVGEGELLPLQASGSQGQVVSWLITAQVHLANRLGYTLVTADLGLPESEAHMPFDPPVNLSDSPHATPCAQRRLQPCCVLARAPLACSPASLLRLSPPQVRHIDAGAVPEARDQSI